MAEALAGMRAMCEQVRVLGSYPAAPRSAPATVRQAVGGRFERGATPAPPLHSALEMESTVPPEPVGSVSPSEHQRHGPESSPRAAMGGRVLVLNATFEPINVCTVRRAVVLLLKEKAELLERGHVGARTPRPRRWRGLS